jgi:hypothetical protein
MIFKTKNVRVSRISSGKASSALKSHLKYLEYRQRDEQHESRQDRYLFDKHSNHIHRKAIHDDVMAERAGDIYYHRMILSPADTEPITDWHQWTRDVMNDLQRHLETDLHWYAVIHQNTDNPHVHVVLRGTGENLETGQAEPVELTPQELKLIKQSGREHSEYDHYRQVQEVLKTLDQDDQREWRREQDRTLFQEPASTFER